MRCLRDLLVFIGEMLDCIDVRLLATSMLLSFILFMMFKAW